LQEGKLHPGEGVCLVQAGSRNCRVVDEKGTKFSFFFFYFILYFYFSHFM